MSNERPLPTLRQSFLCVCKQTWLLARKDLQIELRTGEIVVTGAFFGTILGVLTSAAFFTGPAFARYVAPGAIWLATTFTGIFALSRTWQREREEGALEALLAGPVSRTAIFLGKSIGVVTFLLAIEIVITPVVALLLYLDLSTLGPTLALILFLATIGIASCGTLFGAMTVRTRARELVLSMVVFALLTPTLVIGVAATRQLIDGASLWELLDYIKLLIVFDLVFVLGGAATFGYLIEH